MEQTTAPDEPAVIAPARARRRRAWRLVVLVGVAVISAYVVFGAPGQGFPGRAGIEELHRVESEINRAYAECGVDHRATINWFWGSVEVPGNGIAGDLPLDLQLTPEELGHATGSRAYFWLVCPVTPTTSR